jgi:hypothetical protein
MPFNASYNLKKERDFMSPTDSPISTTSTPETITPKTLDLTFTLTPSGAGAPGSIGTIVKCLKCGGEVGVANNDLESGGHDWMQRHAVVVHGFAETPNYPVVGDVKMPDTPKGETTITVTGEPLLPKTKAEATTPVEETTAPPGIE